MSAPAEAGASPQHSKADDELDAALECLSNAYDLDDPVAIAAAKRLVSAARKALREGSSIAASEHTIHVGAMSTYRIRVTPAPDGWFRWQRIGRYIAEGKGETGLARSVEHALKDAAIVLEHREIEASGTSGT